MQNLKLQIELQPKQIELLRLLERGTAEVIGFGGARGGAKSHGVRACNLIRRLKYPNTDSLVFRRTFPELNRNHILPTFRDWPQLRDWYVKDEHTINFPNGSHTTYASADDDRAWDKLQGAEFADIFVDEAGQNEEERVVWLRTVLRCVTNREIVPRMVLTMNPGGIGHAFVKRVFIDRNFRRNERPEDFVFLQAHGYDNVEWCRPALNRKGITIREYYEWPEEQRFKFFITESQYGRTLDGLPGRLRDANLVGRWDVFEGQYFDVFDYDANTVELEDVMPREQSADEERAEIEEGIVRMKPWHTRWLSGDWGFNDDCVIHWNAVTEAGLFTTYRELTVDHMTADKLGEQILEMNAGDPISFFAFSPDAFAQKQSLRTVADELGDVLIAGGLPAPEKADNDRIGGWQLMYQMLAARTWRITRNCRTLIGSIPVLQADPDKVNDVAESPVDHAPDSARYGLKTYVASPREPVHLKAMRMVTSQDPTIRAIQNLKAEAMIEKASQPVKFRRRRYC
jgi:phage terminase large subunit